MFGMISIWYSPCRQATVIKTPGVEIRIRDEWGHLVEPGIKILLDRATVNLIAVRDSQNIVRHLVRGVPADRENILITAGIIDAIKEHLRKEELVSQLYGGNQHPESSWLRTITGHEPIEGYFN